jgi:hypothetical protein
MEHSGVSRRLLRYAEHSYKQHWACFVCRKAFKYAHATEKTCPECGRKMIPMGLDFKAPPKNNLPQWRKVELLHLLGAHFSSSGWTGPGLRPKTLRDLREMMWRGTYPQSPPRKRPTAARKRKSRCAPEESSTPGPRRPAPAPLDCRRSSRTRTVFRRSHT